MYDNKKIKTLKCAGLVAAALLLFLTAFAIGAQVGSMKKAAGMESKKATKMDKNKGLTDEVVNDFLVKYYTRKDLGENRHRYRPLMTDAMYTQAVNNEDQPVNQAYKGYTIDQVFSKSENYIDQKSLTVICHVSYKNTQLQKLGTKQNALLNQNNEATLQLVFIKQGDKYLVNSMSPAVLDVPVDTSGPNSYPTEETAASLASSEEQAEAQQNNDKTEETK